jgi:hypothetical protein
VRRVRVRLLRMVKERSGEALAGHSGGGRGAGGRSGEPGRRRAAKKLRPGPHRMLGTGLDREGIS